MYDTATMSADGTLTLPKRVCETLNLKPGDWVSFRIENGEVLMKKVDLSEIPNAETLAAMRECEEMRKHPERYKRYDNAEKMMEDILKEV